MIRLLYVGAIKRDRFIFEAIKAVTLNDDYDILIKGKDNGHLSGHSYMLCMYNPNKKNNKYGMPTKAYTALKFSMPIIVSKNTEAAKLVEEYHCGIICEYDYDAFVKLLKWLPRDYNYETLSKFAKIAYKIYNWDNDQKKLEKIYKRSNLK